MEPGGGSGAWRVGDPHPTQKLGRVFRTLSWQRSASGNSGWGVPFRWAAAWLHPQP